MAARIRKGDQVRVMAGRDKGRTGEVLRVLPDANRVVVQGVQMIKRHIRASRQGPGRVDEREAAIHLSNVSLLDPQSGGPTRIGFKTLGDGSKVRFARKSGETIV